LHKVRMGDTNGLAEQILTWLERGYPLSILDQYPEIIRNIKLEDINALIRKYFTLDRLCVAVAGTLDDSALPKSHL